MLPKQYGVRRSLLFPVEALRARWQQHSGHTAIGVQAARADDCEAPPPTPTPADAASFEAVNLPNVAQLDASEQCVRADGLRKVFATPDGERVVRGSP